MRSWGNKIENYKKIHRKLSFEANSNNFALFYSVSNKEYIGQKKLFDCMERLLSLLHHRSILFALFYRVYQQKNCLLFIMVALSVITISLSLKLEMSVMQICVFWVAREVLDPCCELLVHK